MVHFDHNLVYLRSEHARMKIQELGQQLKKSPQSLKYSLSVLEKEGILKDPFTIFDYSYFGLILFRVYFKGAYIGDRDKAASIQKLVENKYVVALYEMTGEYDLAIEMVCPNPSRFNKELKKIITDIPTLNHYKIILNLVTYIFPRLYLKDESLLPERNIQIIIGGDRSITFLGSNEIEVMRNLLLNPLQRMTSLAKASKINVKTALHVVKGLEEKKIVLGYKYLVDTAKFGVHKFRLFLKLHNLTKEREAQLREYTLAIKEIVRVNKTIGDWDMEVDIESTDRSMIRRLIIDLREVFIDLIETFQIIEFYQYYKRTYLPAYLFDDKI